MEAAGPAAAGYIARWRPSSVSPRAAAFAREVVMLAGPGGRERAESLLWAAGKLADYAIPLGLEAVPEVLLHPSAVGLTRCAPGLSGAARRTLRTNLRFVMSSQPLIGNADYPQDLYLAHGAELAGEPEVDETAEVRWVPVGETPAMIAGGEILGAITIIGVQHALLRRAAARVAPP